MKASLFSLLLVTLTFVFLGCTSTSQQSQGQNTQTNIQLPPQQSAPEPTCSEYCMEQPHVQCEGTWQISGTYPNCSCSFRCTAEEIQETREEPIEEAPVVERRVARTYSEEENGSVVLRMGATRFAPNTLTVKQGEVVNLTLHNDDVDLQTFTMPRYFLTFNVPPNASITITFNASEAGEFEYQTLLNPDMTGVLYVR